MKFLCICMSPAIDTTIMLPHVPKGEGEIFKDVAEEENVGGKTVNVARWLALRGADVACGGLLGEENDGPFVRELAKYGIDDRFVRVPGSTRRNEMIVWPGGSMKLNRSAFPTLSKIAPGDCGILTDEVLSRMLSLVAGEGQKAVVILSGSLPPAVPKDFYAKAIRYFKEHGFAVVLDASGDAMRIGLEAGPDLIKPNAEECEPLVGFIPKTSDEFIKATSMLRKKAAHVVISDGAAGAWLDGTFAAAHNIDAVDTTAAGDTLLAEFCWRFFSGYVEPSAVLQWAVAAGTAACMMPGGAPPPADMVERFLQKPA